MTTALRFGVVGLGFGRCHASTIAAEEGMELVAVSDLDPESQGIDLDAYAAGKGARGYRDGLRMIDEEELDAVVLAVPPRGREKLIAAAGDRGLAIFLEKPLATDDDHAVALAGLLAAYPASPVMLDFCLRHLPAVARVGALLDGPLGRPLLVNADLVLPRDDSPAWVSDVGNGNGVVNENTCHLFDTLCLLLGEPMSVHAGGGAYRGGPLEDGVAVVLRFAGGAVATLTGGSLGVPAMGTPATLSVYAEHGQARLTGTDHMFNDLTWATADADAPTRETWPLPPRGRISADALRHFAAAVRAGTAPVPGAADGARAVRVAMAVRVSLTTGMPVTLNPIALERTEPGRLSPGPVPRG